MSWACVITSCGTVIDLLLLTSLQLVLVTSSRVELYVSFIVCNSLENDQQTRTRSISKQIMSLFERSTELSNILTVSLFSVTLFFACMVGSALCVVCKLCSILCAVCKLSSILCYGGLTRLTSRVRIAALFINVDQEDVFIANSYT